MNGEHAYQIPVGLQNILIIESSKFIKDFNDGPSVNQTFYRGGNIPFARLRKVTDNPDMASNT